MLINFCNAKQWIQAIDLENNGVVIYFHPDCKDYIYNPLMDHIQPHFLSLGKMNDPRLNEDKESHLKITHAHTAHIQLLPHIHCHFRDKTVTNEVGRLFLKEISSYQKNVTQRLTLQAKAFDDKVASVDFFLRSYFWIQGWRGAQLDETPFITKANLKKLKKHIFPEGKTSIAFRRISNIEEKESEVPTLIPIPLSVSYPESLANLSCAPMREAVGRVEEVQFQNMVLMPLATAVMAIGLFAWNYRNYKKMIKNENRVETQGREIKKNQ